MIKLSEEEYAKQALSKAKENHVWISAFACINPTDETLKDIGRIVLSKLNDKDSLMPASGITDDNETVRELSVLTPYLYIAFNKS